MYDIPNNNYNCYSKSKSVMLWLTFKFFTLPRKQISFMSLLASIACSSSICLSSLATICPKRPWPFGEVGADGGGDGFVRLVNASARHWSTVSVTFIFLELLFGHNFNVAEAFPAVAAAAGLILFPELIPGVMSDSSTLGWGCSVSIVSSTSCTSSWVSWSAWAWNVFYYHY